MGRKNTLINEPQPAEFHVLLRAWYAKCGRKDLPWRNTRDPYAIWLSETMLQQTQVATVLARYYFPFLERFPTIEALAAAPQQDVLKAWQGLGYYNRAVNLHKAAQAGQLPDSVDALMALPGIGRNTAHAIAAFAFRQPVPVLEANVKRVVARIFAIEQPNDKEMWTLATSLVDHENPFDYNQAMMDLGAMVCTPRAPQCLICPANVICKGKTSPDAYPAPKKAKAVKVRSRTIVVQRDKAGRYHARPRQSRFLHGLYEFDESERAQGKKLGHITQVYSHFTLEADVYLAESNAPVYNEGWYSLEELRALPHSKAEEKILELLVNEI